ncbi:MAG TPA: Ig-like domain repeat protein, partial [Pyrinomonadaceae bacterium]|nr:Ig-like domain repeat protein [Pyrinomonadaceae bacterium]
AFRGGPTRTHVPLPDSAAVGAGADATALDGPVDDSQATVNLTDAAAIPVGLLIRVGDEQMLVNAKSNNTLTVTRAANGTTATAHEGGAAVNPAFDQRGAGFARKTGSAVDIGAAEADYAINAAAGTPQSVTLGTLFPALLKATVTESGSPVVGLSVNFDAPASGASGTFTGTGTNSASALTDSDGVATAPAFNANAVAGAYNVAASLAGGSPSVNFGLTNLKLGQTITFDALPGKTFGDAPFTVSATGGASGKAVTFSSTTPAFCSVSANTVTILAATIHVGDTCTVRASQAGNDSYEAAQDVDRSFSIARAGSTTAVNCPGSVTYNGSAQTPCTANVTGAGGLSQTLTVSYTDNTVAGTASATAAFAGDDNHTNSSGSKTFTITKAPSTTTVTCAGGNVYTGSPLTPCTASVTGAGGFSQSPTVNYKDNTVVGTATAAADFLGDANHDGSSDSKTFQIAKADSTVTVTCPASVTYDGSAQTPCSASVSGAGGLSQSLTVTYSNNVNAGTGTATASADYIGDANHDRSNGSKTFSIGKAVSTTTVLVSDAVYDGQPHGATATVTGAGGLSQNLTVTYTGRNGTSYPASTNAPTNAGDYTATASFTDGNHATSSDSKDFRIAKAAQTITFGAPADRTFGDADFLLDVSASSGLGVTFDWSGQCAVSNSKVHITGAGSCTVTASQGGDGNYEAAASVSRSFQIAKASTTTTLSSAPNPSGAGQLLTLTATVTSAAGVPTGAVTFRDGGNVLACSNAGGQALVVGVATCTTAALGAGGHALTAEYTGDANFLASTGSLSGVQTVGGAFEFSRAVYAVTERGGSVAITVRRTGDASQAASVDYSTDDGSTPSVAVACSATTGQALERCDYTRAAGTLQFAANETEKTFVVLVNDDSYVEGTETTALRLSNPSAGAVLGLLNAAALEITDDAAESAANVIDDDEAFVRQHYHDFLNREPDADGLKFWTDGIRACGADAGCREVKRVHTSAAFFLSIEFQQTGYFAYRVHKAAFGDLAGKPVPVTLDNFLRDTQRLGAGVVVNQGDWQAQLEANRQAYAVEFVRRPEFVARHPSTMNATAFVNLLNDDAGGVLDEAEKAALVAELTPNPSDATLRADVLRQVADNAALVLREKNRAFVLMQYIGYLRRNPSDAPEQNLDFAGYNFWLSKLELFGGDFVGAEMVKAFINSVEYRSRFGR